jgi:hypothetical protein
MLRPFTGRLVACILIAALAGCAASEIQQDQAATGRPPLCHAGRDLGEVVVYPRTAWRPDQKEPERRAAIAASAIGRAFADVPCGFVAEIHAIDEPRDWHESEARRAARGAGTDTIILIQVRELGPHGVLSFPTLVSGSAEVVLHVRAIDVNADQTLLDIERRRTVGGAYVVESVDDLEAEMVTALKGLIGGVGETPDPLDAPAPS